MPKNKSWTPLQTIIAGGAAGAIEICITFPTEYVKTQLQSFPNKYRSLGHVVTSTIREFGPRGLYRGLTPLVIGSTPKTAVRFFTYESTKNYFYPNKELAPLQHLYCGLAAGVSEAVFAVCPMETIKVRVINAPKGQYKGTFDGVSQIVRAEGPGGIYRGLSATIMKQGSNQAIRFTTFAKIQALIKSDDDDKHSVIQVFKSLFAGGAAGATSVLLNTPVDVIKTKLQGPEAKKLYTGVFDCCKKTYISGGIPGFYKGTLARLTRVVADVAIVMTLYPYIADFLTMVWPKKPDKSI